MDLEEVVTLALRSPDHWTAPLFDQMLFEHLRFGPSDDMYGLLHAVPLDFLYCFIPRHPGCRVSFLTCWLLVCVF